MHKFHGPTNFKSSDKSSLRCAIQESNSQQMRIKADPNQGGIKKGSRRTASNTAAHEKGQEVLLAIFLQETSINTNVKTTKGLTTPAQCIRVEQIVLSGMCRRNTTIVQNHFNAMYG